MLLVSCIGKEVMNRHNFMAMGLWLHLSNTVYDHLACKEAYKEVASKIRKYMAENSGTVRRAGITITRLSRLVFNALFYPVQ